MSENNEKQLAAAAPTMAEKKQSKSDLINALKGQFATTVTRVYVNSLNREVSFREVTVQEQKTLTRIMGANEKRKDIVYDAQCALINQACLDPSFDIYQCSDFDRLKLLMSIYQTNMFANEVKFTCSECGAENQYSVDFDNTLSKLDKIQLEEKVFTYENKHFKYSFKVEFPSVSLVSKFYKQYSMKHRDALKRSSNDSAVNMDYVNLFIKTAEIENKSTNAKTAIDFSNYAPSDQEDILATFPQDVLYTQNGVLMFITDQFIKPLNASFDKHECAVCGAVHEKGDVNNAESFF